MPLKATRVVPAKFRPKIDTLAPTRPLGGEKASTWGPAGPLTTTSTGNGIFKGTPDEGRPVLEAAVDKA